MSQKYSDCTLKSCNSEYHQNGNTCDPDVASCSISNGTGKKTWNAVDSKYGDCILQSCNPEYMWKDNSCNKALILVPTGSFQMGNNAESGRDNDEGPEHKVNINNEIYVMDHEVTQEEWKYLFSDNPSNFNSCNQCPVEKINWWEALHYANALSAKENLEQCYTFSGCNSNAVGKDRECSSVAPASDFDKSGVTDTNDLLKCKGYRLPTESEWEYFARAGDTRATYNGDLATPNKCTDNTLNSIAWYCGNSSSKTHNIKTKTANSLGIHGVLGNVREWVWDYYGNYSISDKDDPTGPTTGTERVVRGGDWHGDKPRYNRFSNRRNQNPDDIQSTIGVRLVRSK